MNGENEQHFFERETIGMIEAAAAAEPELAGQFADAYFFDGSITVPHGEHDSYDPLLPYRIVRRLRGGRDFDPSKPADWHFTSAVPFTRETIGGPRVVGTTLCFSRTFPAPADYSEPTV